MGGISYFYCIGRKCSELKWGSLMYSFSLNPDNCSVAGQRPAPLARGSLRPPRDIGSVAAPPHWHTKREPPAALQSAPATGEGDGARCRWSGSREAGPDRAGSPEG